jgi:hypothetical protein
MWYWHESMDWWMAFGGLWILVFWGLIIGLVIWYLNVSGLYKVMREARKRRVAHDRRERALAR